MAGALPLQNRSPGLVAPADGGPSPQVAAEIVEGLCAPAPFVSPKFLYDPLGSRLFEAITELPEYYPTRTEKEILDRHIGSIALSAGPASILIELGAGSCEKARRLLRPLKPAQFVALDISAAFLENAVAALQRVHPEIEMMPVGGDFTAGIRLPGTVRRGHRLFLYLGSSIGNFDPAKALALLADIRAHCEGSGSLVIGVDLLKPESVLNAAYDDALGVTAAFNLNLLNHVNELIGSNFRVCDWRHRARFNARQSRVEMHLEARRDVLVAWPGGSRRFAEGDSIHTENSYKYRLADFKALLARAGFATTDAWTDPRDWFALCHAMA